LTILELSNNIIGKEGAKYIEEGLQKNITLTILNLGCNLMEYEIEINKLIQLNKKYKKLMKKQYKLLQEEIIEISLVPPDNNNISVLRNGGPMYKELSKKYN
jgi:hypothetical protein